MNREKIRALLEKYYEGDSSFEEEKLLRNYFLGDHIDDEFLPHRDIFIFSENEINKDIPDISNEIWDNIQNSNNVKTFKKRKLMHNYLSIAASIAILIVSFFFIRDEIQNKDTIQFEDTYENPELAYLQAKEALLYVSTKLNSGTEHLEPIKKLDKGAEELKVLSTFNQGLNELKTIEKYNIAKKYIK